jgi:hypothetical protein
MKYPIEMGSGAMMYIPKFHKDCFSDSKVYKGDTQTHRQHADHINQL